MLTITTVLFAIDGTLVDSNEQQVTAWGFAFREAGHPQEVDDIRGQIGKGGDLLVPVLAPALSVGMRKTISDSHGAYFKQVYIEDVQAFPGAAELVR